jgi:S-adenosylmethionine/arginine decarboxylase-like enzyme
MYWGQHLLIDARAGHIPSVTSKENIAKFVDDLVVKIDMIKYGPLWIERFATHDPVKSGISFVQMIETSNICGHFVDVSGDFYLDVFSCKAFSTDEVLKLIDEYFQPLSYSYKIVNRDAVLEPLLAYDR